MDRSSLTNLMAMALAYASLSTSNPGRYTKYHQKTPENFYDNERVKAAEEKRVKRAERNRRLGGN